MNIIFPEYLYYLNFALCFSVFLFFACFHVYASLVRFKYAFLAAKSLFKFDSQNLDRIGDYSDDYTNTDDKPDGISGTNVIKHFTDVIP